MDLIASDRKEALYLTEEGQWFLVMRISTGVLVQRPIDPEIAKVWLKLHDCSRVLASHFRSLVK